MNSTRNRIKVISQIALLSAIVVILQVFLSSIKIGPVTLSFVLIPIVISAVFISPLAGCVVGAVAGITTIILVFTSGDPFYIMLVSVNPWLTALLCLMKTAIAGWVSGELYKIISKFSKNQNLNILIPAAICPIINTGLFCLTMIFGFKDGIMELFGSTTSGGIIYVVFILLAGINFVVEFFLNVILCPIIGKALRSTNIFNSNK